MHHPPYLGPGRCSTLPDSMQQTGDQPMTDQTTDRRVTVPEAAVLLGLSEDAICSRLKRGTLRKEKGIDGTVYVALRPSEPTDRPTNRPMTNHRPANRPTKAA